MPNGGYVKIWRKIKAHEFWQKKRVFSKFEAWVDMIMQANGIDKTVIFRDEYIPVKRGQFIASERKLAVDWKWSRDKVRRFLNYCVKNKMIVLQKRYQRYTIITILKYNSYNPKPTSDKTTEKPQTRPQKNLTNKDNKDNKENIYIEDNENTLSSCSENSFSKIDIELTQFLIDKILENNPKSRVKRLTKKQQETWLIECRRMREIDERTPEEIYKVIEFSQEDNFWKGVILSMPKLRQKFDQLWLKAKNTKVSGIKEWLEEKLKEEESDPY